MCVVELELLERKRLESDNTEETPEPRTAQDTDIQRGRVTDRCFWMRENLTGSPAM